ncbi:hypothetical protein [Sphingobacterium thalpophilum]|uniref:hypothetical protein n=1 Tax=Sphingobacterium thalpophilum TaxID=259 RepID=UPI003C755CC4
MKESRNLIFSNQIHSLIQTVLRFIKLTFLNSYIRQISKHWNTVQMTFFSVCPFNRFKRPKEIAFASVSHFWYPIAFPFTQSLRASLEIISNFA